MSLREAANGPGDAGMPSLRPPARRKRPPPPYGHPSPPPSPPPTRPSKVVAAPPSAPESSCTSSCAGKVIKEDDHQKSPKGPSTSEETMTYMVKRPPPALHGSNSATSNTFSSMANASVATSTSPTLPSLEPTNSQASPPPSTRQNRPAAVSSSTRHFMQMTRPTTRRLHGTPLAASPAIVEEQEEENEEEGAHKENAKVAPLVKIQLEDEKTIAYCREDDDEKKNSTLTASPGTVIEPRSKPPLNYSAGSSLSKEQAYEKEDAKYEMVQEKRLPAAGSYTSGALSNAAGATTPSSTSTRAANARRRPAPTEMMESLIDLERLPPPPPTDQDPERASIEPGAYACRRQRAQDHGGRGAGLASSIVSSWISTPTLEEVLRSSGDSVDLEDPNSSKRVSTALHVLGELAEDDEDIESQNEEFPASSLREDGRNDSEHDHDGKVLSARPVLLSTSKKGKGGDGSDRNTSPTTTNVTLPTDRDDDDDKEDAAMSGMPAASCEPKKKSVLFLSARHVTASMQASDGDEDSKASDKPKQSRKYPLWKALFCCFVPTKERQSPGNASALAVSSAN